jgi:hypothetical protein
MAAGVNLTPGILLSGNTVDDITGTHTEPTITAGGSSNRIIVGGGF